MGREDLEREVKRLREDNDVLREALRVSLCDEATMRETLKHTQGRCTELLEECRALRRVAP
jgi:hypothetical protein